MLIDEADITVSGGHGGPGKASFFKKGIGPDGGDGGRGGDLYFETTSNLLALNRFSGAKNFCAPNGEAGESNRKSGLGGKDLVLTVPAGTDIIDLDTNEIFPMEVSGQKILIAKGGLGGLGNNSLKNARMTTPIHAQHGLPGQSRRLKLVLKLVADFGLVGLPNAGKSSLLNALTKSNAKVGNYPFTTLEPNLGVANSKIIADIPGLISGASQGKGLGTRFLKHIEKVAVILHCLSAETPDPVKDYSTVREELGAYSQLLLAKKEIILLTKTDVVTPAQIKKITQALKEIKHLIIPVSVLDDNTINRVMEVIK